MPTRRFALALVLLLAACGAQTRPPPPPPPSQPSAAGLDPVAGQWDAGPEATLRAQPSPGAPVVGRLVPGRPVSVLGRVRNSDWIAVSNGGSTAYVRLHLLNLHDSAAPSAKGVTTVVPKAVDNGGPKVNAAPRGKIQAAPIAQ